MAEWKSRNAELECRALPRAWQSYAPTSLMRRDNDDVDDDDFDDDVDDDADGESTE